MPSWTEFWAKARPHGEAGPAKHPFLAHALDVAAVAVLIPHPLRNSIPRQTLGFLTALHDVGKLSRPFQAKEARHWPEQVLGLLQPTDIAGPRHDEVGFKLLQSELPALLDPVLPPRRPGVKGWTDGDRSHLVQALAGHHGSPVVAIERGADGLCRACKMAAGEFIQAMLDLFRPEPIALPANVAQFGWDLAGVVTLSDWIGSRQRWFPYATAAEASDPAAYFWNRALPRASAALAAAGITGTAPSRFNGIQGLFPALSTPSPIQRWAETVPLPPGPVLAVIEDVTGSGKTEAAVILTHRLLASGQARGVFMALPTMATANAMFGRMADSYRALFQPGSHPSLVLAHGRAALDPRFGAVMDGAAVPNRDAAHPADTPSEIHCASWLAEDRRRALLAEFGVGTIDQALLAVLPVRHAVLRLQGLKGKVLVVDEVHAFDRYMQRELVELLRFHAALGGSVILLSATLTKSDRAILVTAFRNGLGSQRVELPENKYPLATLASATTVVETACPIRDGLARRVTVTRLPSVDAALSRILDAAHAGAAVAWVRNTVDDAIAASTCLRAAGLEPLLFHARFAMTDRLVVEAEVLRRFGRRSVGAERRGVLIATQVVEQSLDLDFDLLCTDLAPVDLLIQRAGRLWRHSDRGERPVAGPEMLVVSPEPISDPGPGWIRDMLPGTAAVYQDPALLWRSARAVFGAGAITTPDDVRVLIEAVADTETDGAIPSGLAAQAGRKEGKDRAEHELGRQNVLSLKMGYTRGNGLWEPDTRTPTRLEDRPHVTLRLALVRNGAVVPYAEDPDLRRGWSLSEVSVAASRIAACPVPPGLENAAEAARAQWGRWERDSPTILLAVMRQEGSSYAIQIRTKKEDTAIVQYDPRLGLLLSSATSG